MNAIIMGATSGMGREVALRLLKAGYTIGVAGRRSEALEELRQVDPDHVFTKAIDVTSETAVSLFNELIEEMGGMDLYFHSSGYGKQNDSLDAQYEKQTVLTNGLGFTQMIDAAFNYFKNSGKKGHIAAITSIAGTKGLGAAPSYAATKRYQWTYLEALAQLANMQKMNLVITDIRPGFVATDFIPADKYPMLLNKEFVADEIMKALRKQKRKLIIDWRYRILCFFWRLIPSCIWEKLAITTKSN